MTADDEYFSDIQELENGGIFSGEGLNDLNTVRTRLTEKGYLIIGRCERCGRPQNVTANWLDLTYMSKSLIPPDWWHDPRTGLLRSKTGCPACPPPPPALNFGLTPDECQRQLDKAIQYRFLAPQQYLALRQTVERTPVRR